MAVILHLNPRFQEHEFAQWLEESSNVIAQPQALAYRSVQTRVSVTTEEKVKQQQGGIGIVGKSYGCPETHGQLTLVQPGH